VASESDIFSGIGESRRAANEASGNARGFAQIALNIPRITPTTGAALGGSGGGDFPVNLDLYDPERPTVNVPLFSPDIDLAELMDLASDGNITYFTEKLADEFTKFMNSWFPDHGVHIDDLQARVTAMLNGESGLPRAIEDAIWERGRSRIGKDYLALTQTVASEMSSRGFSIPNGVMVARLDEAKFAGHSATAGFSRDVAIRQAEIAIENLRFAMTMAANHRKDAINAAIQFVGSIMTTILDKGIEKAKLIVDAKTALWDASNRYYATLIDNGRLMLGYEQLLETRSIEIARLMTSIAQGDTERYTNGAVAGATSMANIAASAYSSLNTLTTAAHDTIAGE
jgi:hypothetical protein